MLQKTAAEKWPGAPDTSGWFELADWDTSMKGCILAAAGLCEELAHPGHGGGEASLSGRGAGVLWGGRRGLGRVIKMRLRGKQMNLLG